MQNIGSAVVNDKKTKFLALYTAKDEGCTMLPVQSAVSSLDGQLTEKVVRQRPRSFSLYDTISECQPLLKIKKYATNEDFSPDETYLSVPAVTLPKPSRHSRKSRKLNTLLLEAVKHHDVKEIERLIRVGASPNATCHIDYISACHLAAMRSDNALAILLSFDANRQRTDRLGRTPLHLAAWAGNVRQIAILLGFPEDIQNRLNEGIMSAETAEEVKNLSQNVKGLVDVKCDFSRANGNLSNDWKDKTIDYNCKEFERSLPLCQPGWTALHAASARAQSRCTRLLLAAGADPCARDLVGRTPLDIAGSAYYACQNIDPQKFAETVTMLINADSKSFTIKNRKTLDSPLHTAVEVGSLEAVSALVSANVPVTWLNRDGMTPLHICVKKKLKDHLQILANNGVNDTNIPTVDVKDKEGHTVLHKAILETWAPGVYVAIEAGANIIAKDNKGETPIHLAAMAGDVIILNEILNLASQAGVIDPINGETETPLFKAVIHGHLECVKRLLQEGASIQRTLPKQVNIFHVAAKMGNLEVLTILLDHNYAITRGMVNYQTADDNKGYGPIHFAVENNHTKCVKILLSRNAYRSLKTTVGLHKGSTPLHIAATSNNVEIAKILLKNNEDTVHTINDVGWTPLHIAIHYRSRNMITLLLKNGANLSDTTNGPKKSEKTALDMIMNNLAKPTEFLESIFDTYIYTNNLNLHDPKCEITIDFLILLPNTEEKAQMKVIDALLKTGDRYGQRRLLVHPLIESFIIFKWKNLLPFFYTMIIFHALFVLSLTTFIISVFFYKDTGNETPAIFYAPVWSLVLYLTIVLIIIQEMLYMHVNYNYYLQLETCVKFSSICLALILIHTISNTPLTEVDWPRHVATGALLLSWLEMMFLLSRFPDWGYYVLMFGKVSMKVIKILLTFAFLVIGFSFSFMIQFHSQIPFETPWSALVKTMVMMTSEFDYDDLVKQNDSKEFVTSLVMIRIIFFIFLILAAIVLMNLMVGVAVNDLHNLQILGNVRRLEKQIEFLDSRENLDSNNKILNLLLSDRLKNMFRNNKKISSSFVLSPSNPKSESYKALPSHIREAIFEKAQSQKKQVDDELGSLNYRNKLDEIYNATVKIKQENITITNVQTDEVQTDTYNKEIRKNIEQLAAELSDIKNQTKLSITEIKSAIKELNIKIDIILNKLENN